MNAKEQLEQTLIISLMPVIPSDSMEEAKARILMSLADYDVTKNETLPVVYEGDINEQMLKRFIAAKVAAGRTPRTIRFYLITIKKVLEDINKPYTFRTEYIDCCTWCKESIDEVIKKVAEEHRKDREKWT